MKKLMENIKNSIFDLSKYNIEFKDGSFILDDKELLEKISKQIANDSGFAVCYGVKNILGKHGAHVRDHVDATRDLLEKVFRDSMALVDFDKYNVIKCEYAKIGIIDVDGYNRNVAFSPNEYTPEREFETTKCVHFDGATPFVANMYGPTENIKGGYPILSDVRLYCEENNIDPKDIIESISETYNIAMKAENNEKILNDYSVGFKVDNENDIPIFITHNEIGQIAHAATNPIKVDEDKPAKRPIRHLEYQLKDLKDAATWFSYWGINFGLAKDMSVDDNHININRHSDSALLFNHFYVID